MLHFKLRQISFPFKELMQLIPAHGSLWDVGCGLGNLAKLLGQRNPQQEIYVFDIDAKKLQVENLRWGEPKPLVNTITLIDVLYLMTDTQKLKLLKKLFKKLKRGGQLFVAIVPQEKSWGYYLAWLQEWVMVKLVSKTKSEQGVINFETERWLTTKLKRVGFRKIKRYQLPRTLFFWHKHVLFVARK